jgi:serine/threonine protein kinase
VTESDQTPPVEPPKRPERPELTEPSDEGHGSLALPAGTQLQEFTILSVIGEGGFGIVYLADDTLLGRRVAIKEYMPSQLAARTSKATVHVKSAKHTLAFDSGRRSFVNEAKMLAQFKHRALVEVFRFWEQNGTAYIVMPFYEGPTLRGYLSKSSQPVTEEWLCKLLAPLTEALEHMHQAKVFHRDIAPDNVLIVEGDQPVLLDLGAARKIIAEATQAITVMLKPGYAPIEQYADDDSVKQGPWTDVYALAALVYFCISRKSPVPSVARLSLDMLVPLNKIVPEGFRPEFLDAVQWGLAVRPEDRPQSMAEFRRALGLDLAGRPSSINRAPASSAPKVNSESTALEALAGVTKRQKTQIPAESMDPLAGFEKQAAPESVPVPKAPDEELNVASNQSASSTLDMLTSAPPLRAPKSRTKSLIIAASIALIAILYFWLSSGKKPPVEVPASVPVPAAVETPVLAPPVAAPVTPTVVVPPTPSPSLPSIPAPVPAPPEPAVTSVPPVPVPVADGSLNLTVKPWGEVFIDNVSKGVSPPLKRLKLPAGTYQLEIKNPGGPSLMRQLEVKPGEALSLTHQF